MKPASKLTTPGTPGTVGADAEALRILRAEGVKVYEVNEHGYRVEFFAPVTAQDAPAPEALPPATGEERCECACLLSDHEPGGGTCLHGCPAEKCGLPEEER